MEKKEITQQVREYFSSPRTTPLISAINSRAHIAKKNIVPSSIYALICGEITPSDFSENFIKNSGLSERKAKAVIREIKEKILRPIDLPLRNAGININEIRTDEFPTIEEYRKERNKLLKSIGEEPEFDENEISLEPETIKSDSISLNVFAPEIGEGKGEETIKITTDNSKKTADSSPAPFVLHREKSPVGTATFPGSKKPAPASSKSFSLPFGFFKPKETKKSTGPVRVKVELPGVLPKKEGEKTIHYSELRTPLYPFQKETQFIRTDKPKTPIDILSKKEPPKHKGVVIRNSIMNIPVGLLPTPSPSPIRPLPSKEKEFPKKEILPEKEEKKIDASVEKPELTGKGFFWKFKKGKEEDKKPLPKKDNIEKAATLKGNKIDLRQ